MLSDLFHGFVGGFLRLVVFESAKAKLDGATDRVDRYRERRLKQQEEAPNENSGKEGPDAQDRRNGGMEGAEHQVYIPEFYEASVGTESGNGYSSKSESFPKEPVYTDAFPEFPRDDEAQSNRQQREAFRRRGGCPYDEERKID